jgi:hypothetical protein
MIPNRSFRDRCSRVTEGVFVMSALPTNRPERRNKLHKVKDNREIWRSQYLLD